MVIAGRVLIIPKGAWSNLTPYEMLDIVSEGDKAYLARQASVGMRPSEDASMTYWQPFGSSASIATTDTPGLVMPDGVTITVDATGLIVASLNVSDLKDIKITNLANGNVLMYNGTQSKWVNVALGTAATRNATSEITDESTDLIESGAVSSLKQTSYLTSDSTESSIDGTDYIPFYDTSAQEKKKILVSNLNLDNESKADKSDLASISITGSTNNTGSTITSGTFFYKSGVLVQAILDIADGATLTENTNYEVVTAGGLNKLRSDLNNLVIVKRLSLNNQSFTANTDKLIEFSSLISSNCPTGYTFRYYTYAGVFPNTTWQFSMSLIRNADNTSASDTRLRLVSSVTGSFNVAIYAYYYKKV